MSFYKLQNGENINQAISELPKAEDMKLYAGEFYQDVPNFKTIKVGFQGKEHFVYCPTTRYKLVQHEEAFRPIIEGLTQAGQTNFKFSLINNEKFASLRIHVSGEGYDSVSLGFDVTNSFDGSEAISYGFKTLRNQKWIELVGYRQVCSNGMKIRVPLDQAEFIRPELREKVTELLEHHARILHTSKVFEKIELMQYVVEAMSLLKEPVEAIIKKSQTFKLLDKERAEELIKKHVGERYKKKIMAKYMDDIEDNSLWSLYNAITNFASHTDDLKVVTRENLLDKASTMLYEEMQTIKA